MADHEAVTLDRPRAEILDPEPATPTAVPDVSSAGSGAAPARARRRFYPAAVGFAIVAAYTGFVLVNTQLVGFDTRVPFLLWLYLQDGLDIVAAAALVMLAVAVLDRLLARDQERLVATLDSLARVAALARRIGAAATFRQQVSSIEQASQEQVADLAATFGEMLTRLEEAVEGQRRFLADTSHELRNPLASLAMNLALLQREDLASTVRQEAARDALGEVQRMQRLVNDLLLLARGSPAELLQLEVLELDQLVASVTDGRPSNGSGVPVGLGVVEPATVLGDPGRLRQVLRNLIENAARHTPDTGTITLAVRQARGAAGAAEWAVITCTDTGCGIAPEHLPYVFERFYRVGRSRERAGGGAGLGLAIVKHLVEAHGGRVELVSAVGLGTTVTVYLPLATPDA